MGDFLIYGGWGGGGSAQTKDKVAKVQHPRTVRTAGLSSYTCSAVACVLSQMFSSGNIVFICIWKAFVSFRK